MATDKPKDEEKRPAKKNRLGDHKPSADDWKGYWDKAQQEEDRHDHRISDEIKKSQKSSPNSLTNDL
ncbi:MAG TPA: hypothetical protein PLN33_17340 [Hyphomonadaceae bacterium]|nr:hypothetical protein [Hyphomonadaceae bacterium]